MNFLDQDVKKVLASPTKLCYELIHKQYKLATEQAHIEKLSLLVRSKWHLL